jgi:FkbM family methyltransferase
METDTDRQACKVVRLKDGILVVVPDSVGLITPYVLEEQQDWFEDETDFLRAFLEPGMKVIDIGANFGIYTLIAAASVGEHGHVWSFEPTSFTADCLARSLEQNTVGNVTLLREAVSDHMGVARLTLEDNCEMNSLHESVQGRAYEEVRVVSLDHAMATHAMADIDFLKLDAEGQECRILDGASDFWQNESPLVMFEFKHNQTVNVELVERFVALNFKIYRYHPGPGILVPFDSQVKLDPFWGNLFACRPDRANQLARRGLLTQASAIVSESVPDGDANAWMREIIRLFNLSRDESRSATERINAVYVAYRLAQTGGNDTPSIPWLCTLARLACAIGLRADVCHILNQALTQLDSFSPVTCPIFLPAHSRFDHIPPGEDLKLWFTAMIYEQLEESHSYSSYYSVEKTLENLQQLLPTGFASDHMFRRLDLIKRRVATSG